uniref:ATP synthase subunit a n=1 Tax=Salpa fusiformis TaxID=942554 RepID=A0A2Z5U2X2_9UROC|nr:ATP synthase F0 subunit 6 [Salpa fusiformis]
MLLSLDLSPFIIMGLLMFLPLTSNNKGWGMMFMLSMFFILVGLVPMSSSVFSLAPLVATGSLCLWVSSILKRFIPYNASHAYYLPTGVPYPLIPLLYFLEIISDLVRPLALTVRIVVNLSLGHLFIHGSAGSLFGVALTLILVFELAVAFIQGYIYCSLPSLW